MGCKYSVVEVQRYRYRCSNENCEYSEITDIPFKSKEHLLTEPLWKYAETLLAYGMTLKEEAYVTGLHKNVVKDIDKARLKALYVTVDEKGHRVLIKLETQAKNLGIDEFKLHDDYRYATLIMNMKTGCL